ncbi:MAG TPA: hypothetical protein VFZ56_12010 [Gemmatimonadaceae bacterium]
MPRRALTSLAIAAGAAGILGGCGSSTEPRSTATLSATTATSLSGTVGTEVSPTPAVRVLNQDGTPVQGATVSFQVTSGGGAVANASATTDASGTASSGSWVLGPAVGTHTLTASMTGSESVVFSAQAQANVCEVRTMIAVSDVATAALASGDCVISGAFADHYSLTTGAGQSVEITLSSLDFDTFLGVASATGAPVAANDDAPAVTTTNSRIRILPAAGLHTITATSFGPGMSGAYTLRVEAAAESAEDCDLTFIERGVTTQQTLSDTDCLLEPPYFDDQFFIYLSAGSQLRVRQSSQEFDAYLLLLGPGGGVVAENDDATDATTDAQIVHTAAISGFYLISASSALEGETGAYSLAVDFPPAAIGMSPLRTGQATRATRVGGRKPGATR